MEQSIEVGSIWIDKSGENPVIVLAHNKQRQSISFTYLLTINGKLDLTEAFSSVELFLKTKELMVTSSTANTEYVKGKTDGYGEGYQHGFTLAKEKITELSDNELESIIDDAFQEGYAQAYSELHAPTTERERQLQEKAWDEGYVSAIEDYLAQGDAFIGNACYARCSEFGAVGDCESGHLGEKFDVTEGVNVIDFIKKNFDNIKSFVQVGDVGSIEMFDKFNSGVCGSNELEKELSLVEKYPHYYKDIRHLNIIDIYRFFDLFEVTDPCIQHSMKKLAVGGKRGAKDYEKDIKEAMDTLSRWEYMQEENKRGLGD